MDTRDRSFREPLLRFGPGPRLDRVARLVDALRLDASQTPGVTPARALPQVSRWSDVLELLGFGPEDRVVLDVDHLPLEDIGIVRRFLASRPDAAVECLGSDRSSSMARHVLALPRTRWIPWPPSLVELEALLAGPRGAAGRPEAAMPPEAQPGALPAGPRGVSGAGSGAPGLTGAQGMPGTSAAPNGLGRATAARAPATPPAGSSSPAVPPPGGEPAPRDAAARRRSRDVREPVDSVDAQGAPTGGRDPLADARGAEFEESWGPRGLEARGPGSRSAESRSAESRAAEARSADRLDLESLVEEELAVLALHTRGAPRVRFQGSGPLIVRADRRELASVLGALLEVARGLAGASSTIEVKCLIAEAAASGEDRGPFDSREDAEFACVRLFVPCDATIGDAAGRWLEPGGLEGLHPEVSPDALHDLGRLAAARGQRLACRVGAAVAGTSRMVELELGIPLAQAPQRGR